ncbi:MAG: hypothetical protein GY821_11525 [Gammaproteobacteria bacterium]|nr:hypothetical protein [Gammaproteobacteria bacterium]
MGSENSEGQNGRNSRVKADCCILREGARRRKEGSMKGGRDLKGRKRDLDGGRELNGGKELEGGDLEGRSWMEGGTGKEGRCGVGAETLERVRVVGEGVRGRKRQEGWSCREVGKELE